MKQIKGRWGSTAGVEPGKDSLRRCRSLTDRSHPSKEQDQVLFPMTSMSHCHSTNEGVPPPKCKRWVVRIRELDKGWVVRITEPDEGWVVRIREPDEGWKHQHKP